MKSRLVIALGVLLIAAAGVNAEGQSSNATDATEGLACERAQESAQQTAELTLIELSQTMVEGDVPPTMQVYGCECFETQEGAWQCSAAWDVS